MQKARQPGNVAAVNRVWQHAETIAAWVWLAAALALGQWPNPPGIWLAAILAAGVVLAVSWSLHLAFRRPPWWSVLGVPLILAVGVPAALLADVDSLTRMQVVEALGLDRISGNTAIRPIPHDVAAHERLLRIARGGEARIVFLGDSITRRWATDGKAAWDRLFAPLDAVNLGIGGDRVENVLWRIHEGELDDLNVRLIVLLIGTNNLGVNTPGQLTAGVSLLLQEIRQRQPRAVVLLLGLLPRERLGSSPMRERIREVNRRLTSLADGKEVRFLDAGNVLLEDDGTLTEEVAPDGLHLSAEGYRRLGGAIEPALELP
jgi:lysophospholipase L1-like esterase